MNEIYYDVERMKALNEERLERFRNLADELVQKSVLGPAFTGLEDALFVSIEEADEYNHGRSQAEEDVDRLNFDACLEGLTTGVYDLMAENLVYTDEPLDAAEARLELAFYGRTK